MTARDPKTGRFVKRPQPEPITPTKAWDLIAADHASGTFDQVHRYTSSTVRPRKHTARRVAILALLLIALAAAGIWYGAR